MQQSESMICWFVKQKPTPNLATPTTTTTATIISTATNERMLILETEIAKVTRTVITGKAKSYNNTQTIFEEEEDRMIEDGSNTTTILLTIIMATQEAPTTIILVQDVEEDRLPRMAITLLTRNTIATDHRYHTCTSITLRLHT
jgi:hypothetical protein